MHQAQQDQSTRHPHDATPPADPLTLLEPGPIRNVLRHQALTLGAKALAIYVLIQPRGRLFTRNEFERLSLDLSPHLEAVLHELTRAGLLEPYPTGERACCAPFFRLLEDS
jgi:hypothetical protein